MHSRNSIPLKIIGKRVSMSQPEGGYHGLGETPLGNHDAESPFCASGYLLAGSLPTSPSLTQAKARGSKTTNARAAVRMIDTE